ncbi:MAG: DUF805 domain-containing protein [Verrucomicrobiae bacterium]|nr:DUF805 domain-containing protein [Verrucomicrobiae bacterium]
MNYYTDVLKKYTVFEGRARRKEYWMFALFNIIIAVILLAVEIAIGGPGIVYMIYCLAVLLPSLAVCVRRLHDTGKSGWWILISLVPAVGGLILLVFMVMDSQPGDNQFGPNPKGA